MIAIGIDPGTNTGLACWDSTAGKLTVCTSMMIHQAMAWVATTPRDLIIFEDARKRTWFGSTDAKMAKYGAAVREGAGAAKRDASIWDDYLTELGIPFKAKAPQRGGTKWNARHFEMLTHWKGKTNEHGRDAALLVFGLNDPIIAGILRDTHGKRGPSEGTQQADTDARTRDVP